MPTPFPVLADCIRSGQMPEAEVQRLFAEQPVFAAWYRKHILNRTGDAA